ncbi:hypothetical protein A6770_28315 [Nostoc minutum NIES-26]|uniref:Uncharacterized protein n=1 Tax=Nostoc minutum NIES-26 TaxID=1844469 RepID=A0A367QM77_9NOSO|nr:hypothetical protein A6770_28315 [Nostoc minutum NIES-26]
MPSKLQKIDEQDIAQCEFDGYIADQAQAVAPEELTVSEISFYEYEIYCGTQLIASISYDHANFVTQPWVVMVNGVEIFRRSWWQKCFDDISWHYKRGSLPMQEEAGGQEGRGAGEENSSHLTASSTGNEIMVQLFDACEQHGLELLEDGIYQQDVKLGQAGCTNGNWWFTSATQAKPEKIFCDSVEDAVWLLQIPDGLPTTNEYLQYHPLEQLSPGELRRLFETVELVAV